MKVLKFGGTSVGTPESLANVKKIVEALEVPAIVVVSALGGLTDRLIATARLASEDNADYKNEMASIAERHHNVIDAVIAEERKDKVFNIIDELLAALERIYDGISLIKDLPRRTLDAVVSFGERMSSVIVANMLDNAVLADSLRFVKTERWFDKNIADTTLTTSLIKDTFEDSGNRIAVVPGFISTDRDSGEITNLGRGGSDFTAALIAAALDAEILEIWTDVDGFMTADPRIIPEAQVMKEMSFVESMELCSFGAKVIYPPTIYPVFHKNIPIKILNTFNISAPGTLITDLQRNTPEVRGISSIRDIGLVSLLGDFTGNVAEINTRTYNAMARNGINVYLVAQPGESPTFSFALAGTDAMKAVKTLEDEFAPELNSGLLEAINLKNSQSIIAIVGEKIRELIGAKARIVHTLLRNDIEVHASSADTSDTSMLIVVEERYCDTAMRTLHSLFFT